MTDRLLGPTGSAKRRRFLVVPLTATVLVAVLWIAGAQAVHDTGKFQLDGNGSAAVQPPPPNVQNDEDWDYICKAHPVTADKPDGCVFAPGYDVLAVGTTTADPSSWRTDPSGSAQDDTPTQGSTKDDLDLTGWKWKEAKPSPPKNDIAHAFAAEYEADNGDNILFFGGDRISNNGNADIAFWFFQNPVVPVGNDPDGGCSLSACSFGNGSGGPAVHKAGEVPHNPDNVGDILIVSAFTNGGTQPNIKIYEWVGEGNATSPCFTNACSLEPLPLPAGQGAACANDGGVTTGDIACALVNAVNTPSPWVFREADGKVADNVWKDGDFFEGGLNLTGLGLDNACFSSFLLNTRSSQSGDAILHDFALGEFGRCGAVLTTQPSAGVTELTSVSPGQEVTDTATITVTGVDNPPDPSSPPNVAFFLCGPTAVDSVETCSAGTAVGSTKPLVGGTPDDGIATAVSDPVNTAASPLLPGRYCFRATWAGNAQYPGAISDGPYEAGTENTECFVVRQIPTTTVTTPSDGSGVALSSPVALGTQLFDLAVVTGTTAGGSPPGAVNFFICNPSQVSGAAGAEVCAAGAGSALSGNPRTLVADAGSSPPTSRVLSSPGVTANVAGVWCFRATYVPSGTTYLGSSDNSHGECVTVSPDQTTTVTTPVDGSGTAITAPVALNAQVFDRAVVTGTTAGGTPTGDVNFFICSPSQVTGSGASAHCEAGTGTALAGNPRPLSPVAGSNPPAAQATSSPAVTANELGVWCFRATFVPGGANAANYTGSSDNSNGECFTVRTTSSVASLQEWLPNDTITLTSTGGVNLDGTLVVTLREGSCTGTVRYTEPTFTSPAGGWASGTEFETTNGSFSVTAANIAAGGVYFWRAVFTSSNQFVDGFTKCETSTLSINDNP